MISSSVFAAVAAGLGAQPAQADMLKAACTYADCPEAPKDAPIQLELFEVTTFRSRRLAGCIREWHPCSSHDVSSHWSTHPMSAGEKIQVDWRWVFIL